jgi:signal peptidase I
LAILAGVLCTSIVLFWAFGFIQSFFVPTSAMAPAISPGDHVMMEAISYRRHKPRRGDIAVFKNGGTPLLGPPGILVKRVVGEPGDHVLITNGNLYINEKHVLLSNALGRIIYNSPDLSGGMTHLTDVTVPVGHYFVVGDNSMESLDSRFWGFLPADKIIGRISFCYWPPHRIGAVK